MRKKMKNKSHLKQLKEREKAKERERERKIKEFYST